MVCINTQPHQKMDVLHITNHSNFVRNAMEALTSFYNDKMIHTYEYVHSKFLLYPEEFVNNSMLYKNLAVVRADVYSFTPCTFQPMLLTYIHKANSLGTLPYHKILLICVSQDDCIAARIIQLKTSTDVQVCGPYGGTWFPSKLSSKYMLRWGAHEFASPPGIEKQTIHCILRSTDATWLVSQFRSEIFRALWQPIVM